MVISKGAVSGTLESCDALVTIEPCETGLDIQIESVVLSRFGSHILSVVRETLAQLHIESARVLIHDKGALDCTLRARLQSAAYRASGDEESIPWEALKWQK